jgi:hypothetical protein
MKSTPPECIVEYCEVACDPDAQLARMVTTLLHSGRVVTPLLVFTAYSLHKQIYIRSSNLGVPNSGTLHTAAKRLGNTYLKFLKYVLEILSAFYNPSQSPQRIYVGYGYMYWYCWEYDSHCLKADVIRTCLVYSLYWLNYSTINNNSNNMLATLQTARQFFDLP